jgi:hypothetical protein
MEDDTPSIMFETLLILLFKKYGQKVAVLIDEYDAPIIEHIHDSAKADEFRSALKRFYGLLKTYDEVIGHIFITGVSRFTKTSIFSELNNLRDITLDREFASICGLSKDDLEDLIAERGELTLKTLTGLKDMSEGSDVNDLRSLIDQWYDGYSWDGLTRVYNPWSVLNFLASAKFIGHWYDTGTPTFLVELVSRGKISFDLSAEMPSIRDSDNVIGKIASLNPAIIMFQTGYLTIGERLPPATSGGSPSYRLTLPNLEVKAAFVPLLLSLEAPKEPLTAKLWADEARDSLLGLNAEGFERAFHLFLEQHTYDDNNQNEKHYHSLFVSAMTIAGQPLLPHEHTAHGILDIHLRGHDGDEFIIELKVLNERGKTKSLRSDPPEIQREAAREDQGKKPVPCYAGLPVTEKEKASLRKRMATLAKRAIRQINAKYADKFMGRSGRLIKVALIIARRSYVLVNFDVMDGLG